MTDNITIDQNAPDAPVRIDPNAVPDYTAAPAPVIPGQTTRNIPAEPASISAPTPTPARTVPLFGPDGKLYDIPSEKSQGAITAGGSPASPIIAPDGSHLFVPAAKLHDALKAGAKIDDTGWTPEQEKLNHPSLVQRMVGAVTGPGTVGEDITKRWETPTPITVTPGSLHEELSKPLISPVNAMTPEEQKNHPVLAGILEQTGGLSSPENIAIMASTEGLGTLAGPESKLAARALPRLISAGFSIQQIIGAAKTTPEIWDAIKRGDESEALRLTTHVVGDVAMAALAAQHFAGIEAKPTTAIGRRVQAPVDLVGLRISQALKSDTKAMATATAMQRSAEAIYDQRLNEHEAMTDQAVRASQAAIQAKVDFADGKITQQQLDDANTAASKASAEARKATQALSDAHETRAQAGTEVDRMGRKIQRSKNIVNEKQTKEVAGAMEDFKRMAPPTTTRQGQYSDRDLQIAFGYLEQEHENEPIAAVRDHADALQKISDDIDNEVGSHVQKYANDPITTNVRMDVQDKLAESPQVNFVEKGMSELENFNLIDPTISEAQTILTDINALNRGILKKNFWDVATALRSDPAFAARYYAADSLRNGIDGTLVDHGVEGVREKRRDQASIIRVKTAVEKQVEKGGQKVRGSGQAGAIRKAAARGAAWTGAAAGAGLGVATGIPLAPEAGAAVGGLIGKKVGIRIAPGDITRDQIAGQVMSVKGKGVPITEIQGEGTPATQFMGPGAIKRDLTPLHGDLATHYGENVIDSRYTDLEQRFREDLRDKQRHGVPLEPAEKTLLGKINQQDAADALAAQKAAQEAAVSGKSQVREATLPDEVEPLLQAPSAKLASGMDTERGIVHDMAHIVVGDERGIKFTDGIRSHLHSENINQGSLMSAPIDWKPFLDKDGNVDPAKLKDKIADLAATYVAGGVANDLYHDIPFTENHHLGADVSILKKFMKSAGFSEA